MSHSSLMGNQKLLMINFLSRPIPDANLNFLFLNPSSNLSPQNEAISCSVYKYARGQCMHGPINEKRYRLNRKHSTSAPVALHFLLCSRQTHTVHGTPQPCDTLTHTNAHTHGECVILRRASGGKGNYSCTSPSFFSLENAQTERT